MDLSEGNSMKPYLYIQPLGNSSGSNDGLCNENYGLLYPNKTKTADPTHMDIPENVKKNKNAFIAVFTAA